MFEKTQFLQKQSIESCFLHDYNLDKGVLQVVNMKEYPETHQEGIISLENSLMFKDKTIIKGDLGVQIATDGRIWICINGIAFLRFLPKQLQQKV